jgi:electron transport complex protein RnfD
MGANSLPRPEFEAERQLEERAERSAFHFSVGRVVLLVVTAISLYLLAPSHYAAPGFHLFSGASMLGAFFIATDPVSAAASVRGRFIYGLGIGLLIYALRTWGGYPDGVAFAVLLMNGAVPVIDRYTRPRIYGKG